MAYKDKAWLYSNIDSIRKSLNHSNEISINVYKLLETLHIDFEDVNFSNKELFGLLYKCNDQNDIIMLNSSKSKESKTFTLAHELVHHQLHADTLYLCNMRNDATIEYQANEGAAELLVPYRSFIPLVVNKYWDMHRSANCCDLFSSINDYIGCQFNVSSVVIDHRLSSLSYEISQYINGTSLDEIDFKSITFQKKNGIYKDVYKLLSTTC